MTTGTASVLTATSAVLSGTVDAHGIPTAYTFEYGPSNAFGLITAVDSAGAANAAQPVALPVSGLTPHTTYRYRIVATNAAGTTTGTVRSFVTAGGS